MSPLHALSDDILLDIMSYFHMPTLNILCRRFHRLWTTVSLQLYEDPWGVLHSPLPGICETDGFGSHTTIIRSHYLRANVQRIRHLFFKETGDSSSQERSPDDGNGLFGPL